MKIRQKAGPVTCPKCSAEVSALFKVQGQTEAMCAACLQTYATQQGVDKNVILDGMVAASADASTTAGVNNVAVAKLVLELFNARTTAHLLHLQTTSFSVHKALDEFYNEIVSVVDTFVEAFQGKYGVMTDYPSIAPIVATDPVAFLQQLSTSFKAQRTTVPSNDSELQNLLDEVASLIDGILYKLKNLK